MRWSFSSPNTWAAGPANRLRLESRPRWDENPRLELDKEQGGRLSASPAPTTGIRKEEVVGLLPATSQTIRARRPFLEKQIPGATPSLTALPSGCAFKARCTYATSACDTPPAQTFEDARIWRCYHPLNIGAVAPALA